MKRRRDCCPSCGSTELVPAVDNNGAEYMGCPRCVIVGAPIKIRSVESVPRGLSRFVVGDLVIEGNITKEQADELALAMERVLKR
jgi:hypothetical protein